MNDANADLPAAVRAVTDNSYDKLLKRYTPVDGYPTEAALSIGVALTLGGALDVSGLLAQADEALYYAKERGRNRVEVATAEIMLRRKGTATPRLVAAKTAA